MPTPVKGNGKSARPPRAAVAKDHEPLSSTPAKFTYALKQWTVERRTDGWFVSPTTSAVVGNKPEWRGPFLSIESACLAIARGLAVEIADRHTRHVEHHKIEKGQPAVRLQAGHPPLDAAMALPRGAISCH